MEPKSFKQITYEIDVFIDKYEFASSEWYVGIAADPEDRLFNHHQVDREKSTWIYKLADSPETANQVKRAYIKEGLDGDRNDGDDNNAYVYTFVKLLGTVR